MAGPTAAQSSTALAGVQHPCQASCRGTLPHGIPLGEGCGVQVAHAFPNARYDTCAQAMIPGHRCPQGLCLH
jgi:hypothetical protein